VVGPAGFWPGPSFLPGRLLGEEMVRAAGESSRRFAGRELQLDVGCFPSRADAGYVQFRAIAAPAGLTDLNLPAGRARDRDRHLRLVAGGSLASRLESGPRGGRRARTENWCPAHRPTRGGITEHPAGRYRHSLAGAGPFLRASRVRWGAVHQGKVLINRKRSSASTFRSGMVGSPNSTFPFIFEGGPVLASWFTGVEPGKFVVNVRRPGLRRLAGDIAHRIGEYAQGFRPPSFMSRATSGVKPPCLAPGSR